MREAHVSRARKPIVSATATPEISRSFIALAYFLSLRNTTEIETEIAAEELLRKTALFIFSQLTLTLSLSRNTEVSRSCCGQAHSLTDSVFTFVMPLTRASSRVDALANSNTQPTELRTYEYVAPDADRERFFVLSKIITFPLHVS